MDTVVAAISAIAGQADSIKTSMLTILGVVVTVALAWYIASKVGR